VRAILYKKCSTLNVKAELSFLLREGGGSMGCFKEGGEKSTFPKERWRPLRGARNVGLHPIRLRSRRSFVHRNSRRLEGKKKDRVRDFHASNQNA